MAVFKYKSWRAAGRAGPDSPAVEQRWRVWLTYAHLLNPQDRTILKLLAQGCMHRSVLADALGLPRGTLSRRLRRLARRLLDPLALALLDETCPLAPDQRAIAIAHLVAGESVCTLARRFRLTPGRLRRLLDYVRGWHRGAASNKPPPPANPILP